MVYSLNVIGQVPSDNALGDLVEEQGIMMMKTYQWLHAAE